MKLTELEPHWATSRVEGHTSKCEHERHGMGMTFLCPVHRSHRLAVFFKNPVDGFEPDTTSKYLWQREGETFETLTLGPSVDASGNVFPQHPEDVGMIQTSCWHGFIKNGEVT